MYAALLEISPQRAPWYCLTRVQTVEGYTLHYKVKNVRPCMCPTSESCNIPVKMHFDYHYVPVHEYCYSNESTNYGFVDVDANSMTVEIMLNSDKKYSFSIDFYTSHNGQCKSEEVRCNGCVHREIACDPNGQYCDRTDVCSDILDETPVGASKIAGYVSAASLMIVLIFTCCCWIRKDGRAPRFCPCFSKASEEDRTLSARTRERLAAQLASRRISSNRNGNVNNALREERGRVQHVYTEPPPEYSSLEFLEQGCKPAKDIEDSPPSYDDTVKNLKKYKVVNESYIQHI